ncbi:GNAT family N-acetyltransferase [Acaryochloris sp. IP29b_bin.148]|uniref:GNAT family N-acetyltransferase n=1 Tax=Acaryochloris sp. IP29b_bin.148 TaxID=2969218 RepID=UPI0034561F72
MVLTIEPFNKQKHDRSRFCCGQDSLDHYFRKQASQDLKKHISSVFVLMDDSQTSVLAYYTLSAYTIDISSLDTALAKRLPRYPQLPTTLLGRLAVDQQQQGQRFGELMLVDALKRALITSQQVASLAVVAEALNERAVNFYTKYGFHPFRHHPMKLYLPMKSIAALF